MQHDGEIIHSPEPEVAEEVDLVSDEVPTEVYEVAPAILPMDTQLEGPGGPEEVRTPVQPVALRPVPKHAARPPAATVQVPVLELDRELPLNDLWWEA